eukprot:TRINITY_DN377_c0_g1_i3.p3 TRINITY_DN377_c0_g1~~TRINITY_DN377_c0_g1_i3.p3  ORF type:complete len:213 (+),score=49.64 TRINITY_DN377_c0_g1_i3:782-1420(+)
MKKYKILFCQVDPHNQKNYYDRIIDYLGVDQNQFPLILLVKQGEDQQKYLFSKQMTSVNIMEFVQQYINDKSKLEKYIKSQPIPEKNDLPVRVVVGKSFEDEVLRNNKDVLVKFYAPWCSNCQALAPFWIEAATLLANNKNIVIAEFDATENEQSYVTIKGYPTIKFWPGKSKDKPIDFDGQKTTEGIINWLKEKTTYPWVEPLKATTTTDL